MKTIPEQWIEASEWDAKQLNVPSIITRTIAKALRKITSKAKVYKPKIKYPKGEKQKSIPQLKKELDKEFSIFIRRRDCNIDYGYCATCGKHVAWRNADCGHYVPRQDLATRWDEKNCALQCKFCNGFRGGEQEKFAKFLDEKYGDGTAEKLRAMPKSFKLNRDWLIKKIDLYKSKNCIYI